MASMNELWSSTTDEAIKRMAECLRLVIGGRMQYDIIVTLDADELIEPTYFELAG